MARGATPFRQIDVTRALRGAQAAGMKVARVEVDRDGKIVLAADVEAAAGSASNDWDDVLQPDQVKRP